VLVTAGYINPDPWTELCRVTDAANIDLKAMSDRFYREVCGAELAPVLAALVRAKSLGVRVEVTNLVIPTLNDRDQDLRSLSRWVAANLGRETPLHFSRFHPQHRMQHLPGTPADTLRRARDIARAEGLHYVYVGNLLLEGAADTSCPGCGRTLVRRRGYQVLEQQVVDRRCPACGKEIYGLWN